MTSPSALADKARRTFAEHPQRARDIALATITAIIDSDQTDEAKVIAIGAILHGLRTS